MLVVMKPNASREELDAVLDRIRSLSLTPSVIPGARWTAVGVTGNKGSLDPGVFEMLPGVLEAVRVEHPFRLVSRDVKPEDTVIDAGGVPLGGQAIAVMAGPCAVGPEEQLLEVAHAVRAAGAVFLCAGSSGPRTEPREALDLTPDELELLARAREQTGLRVVVEVADTGALARVADYADVVRVGARNMQDFALLRRLGAVDKPVLLERGPSATLKEWLMAAEYVCAHGNPRVALCERGIRTFETLTRSTLDLNAVPMLKALTHLPVLVDPSNGIGVRAHVAAMARAGIAAGADGLVVLVHPRPEQALAGGAQSLAPRELEVLMRQVRIIAQAIERPIATCGGEPPAASSRGTRTRGGR